MVANIKDMTGERFGLLTVLRLLPQRNSFKQTMWVCKCDCGNEATFNGPALRVGGHIYCGKCPYRTLGFKYSVVRRAWLEMLGHHDHSEIDPSWLESIIHFSDDIGPAPGPSWHPKRIDPAKPFIKSNMRWVWGNTVPRKQVRLKIFNCSYSVTQLAEELGMTRQGLHAGLKSGWTERQLELRLEKRRLEMSTK